MWVLGRRYRAHATAFTRARLSCLSPQASTVLPEPAGLSVKSITSNIKYLLVLFTLVANVTLHVLSDSFLFQSARALDRRYRAHATALHARDCPDWSSQDCPA